MISLGSLSFAFVLMNNPVLARELGLFLFLFALSLTSIVLGSFITTRFIVRLFL